MGIIVGDSLSWLWDLLRAATLDGDGDVELGVGAVGAGGGDTSTMGDRRAGPEVAGYRRGS
jgi:hypothetical protein